MDKMNLDEVAQLLSCVWPFEAPWTAARQAFLSFTISLSLLKFNVHPVSDAIQPSHPLLSPSLPSLNPSQHHGLFLISQLFTSGGQSIGASNLASVLPMNIQGCFSLGWTGWISLSPRDSQESSPTPQFRSINSLVLVLCYGLNLTPVHDYWKNHSFDYMNRYHESDVSAF